MSRRHTDLAGLRVRRYYSGMPVQPNIDQLNAQFARKDALRFETGNGGLIKAVISTPSADGEVYLHGGHMTAFVPRGERPVLWMSEKSNYAADKPIRGGIPIIFPWFGARVSDPASPAHGFARTRDWQVESTSHHNDQSIEIVLTLRDDAKSLATWPHAFALHYHVRVGTALGLTLRIENTGKSDFAFEEALHSYFSVGDIRRACVKGLEGMSYIDKVEGFKLKSQGDDAVIITGETDRVYGPTRATCVIEDPVMLRQLSIEKENSESTVVWNPWCVKAKAMADIGDEEWAAMVCVETCNVGDAKVELRPGESHSMRCVISAKSSHR